MRTATAQIDTRTDAVLFASLVVTDTFTWSAADLSPVPSAPEGAFPCVADRDALVMEHLPMVRYVARRVHERVPGCVELDDLVSAGLLGLIDAASKFDGSRQVQFKSYAQIRIRGAILDSLRTLDWSPRGLRRKGRAMAEAIRCLSARLGRTPTDPEIAAEMEMDIRSFQQMTGDLKNLEIGSLNEDHNQEAGDEELDFLVAPADESPLALYEESERQEQLSAALQALPEKERLVLTFYYFDGMTMKEIGLALGVVESRVSQIRSCAITRLRKALGGSRKEAGTRRRRAKMD